jgi:hypothetical protein
VARGGGDGDHDNLMSRENVCRETYSNNCAVKFS